MKRSDRDAPQRIGEAIRERRKALGLSQDAFADRIEMHRAYYSSLERGQTNLTIRTIERICAGLGVKPSKLLDEAGM